MQISRRTSGQTNVRGYSIVQRLANWLWCVKTLLALLSQTHYFSLLCFLSCGPSFIRLSSGLPKRNQNMGRAVVLAHAAMLLRRTEKGVWWLRKEREKALSLLDSFVSEDNSEWVILVCCCREWWTLGVSCPYGSISHVERHQAERFQVIMVPLWNWDPVAFLWKPDELAKGVYFAAYFK